MFVQVMDVYTRYRLGHVLGLPETCQFQVGVLSALLRKYRTFLLARHEFLVSVGDLGLPQKHARRPRSPTETSGSPVRTVMRMAQH